MFYRACGVKKAGGRGLLLLSSLNRPFCFSCGLRLLRNSPEINSRFAVCFGGLLGKTPVEVKAISPRRKPILSTQILLSQTNTIGSPSPREFGQIFFAISSIVVRIHGERGLGGEGFLFFSAASIVAKTCWVFLSTCVQVKRKTRIP